MRVRVVRRGRGAYPATAQRPLTPTPPATPAAVMLWDTTGRLPVLALDFDAKNGHGPHSAARDATDALRLLTDVGLHPIADRSPSGGWHLYARLPHPAAAWDIRQTAAALAARWPTLDPSPLLNPPHGCIRPPGSPHPTGGHQRLLGPLTAAQDALTATPPADAWARLRDRVGAAHHQPDPDPGPLGAAATGTTRRPITAAADTLAATGTHPHREFDTPSEARYSVICSAVNAGWTIADVETALRGPWTWLRTSYGTKHHSALLRDWRKAQNKRNRGLGKRTVRIPDTSPHHPQGGSPTPKLPLDDIHLALRKFTTHARNHARRNHYSPVLRAVLDATIWAGHVQGRTLINIGVRSLAEQAGVHHDTLAQALHTLADDGLIQRLSHGRGADPDVWRLNTELGQHARPARGRRVGIRPLFRTLGGHRAGEIYELLRETRHPLHVRDIVQILGYPRQRVHETLQLLAGFQLATVEPHTGWTLGPANPDTLARQLGGWQHWHDQHQRHQRERAHWRAWLNRHRPPTIPHGQLILDELDAALPEPDWIAEYATGTSPPGTHVEAG